MHDLFLVLVLFNCLVNEKSSWFIPPAPPLWCGNLCFLHLWGYLWEQWVCLWHFTCGVNWMHSILGLRLGCGSTWHCLLFILSNFISFHTLKMTTCLFISGYPLSVSHYLLSKLYAIWMHIFFLCLWVVSYALIICVMLIMSVTIVFIVRLLCQFSHSWYKLYINNMYWCVSMVLIPPNIYHHSSWLPYLVGTSKFG